MRRLSRLDVYRVDTYSRVQGQSKAQVTGSKVGRSTSADYGLFLARARAGGGGASGRSQRSHTSQPDGRGRARPGLTPRHNQSHSHWAYFRSEPVQRLQMSTTNSTYGSYF